MKNLLFQILLLLLLFPSCQKDCQKCEEQKLVILHTSVQGRDTVINDIAIKEYCDESEIKDTEDTEDVINGFRITKIKIKCD